MTSPFPMFSASLLSEGCAYFSNCFTDVDNIIDKLDMLSGLKWEKVNSSSNDCFDVKLNHSKNNIYTKRISLSDKSMYDDKKSLYVINSLRMAADFISERYSRAYSLNIKNSDIVDIYKQDPSTIFVDSYLDKDNYTVIMFFNESLDSKDFYIHGENGISFKPGKSCCIVIPPNIKYSMNYFYNEVQHYAVYKFSLI